MGPGLNATGKQVEKSEQRDAKFKNAFLLLKTINFTVINVNRYQLKSLKYSYIYHQRKQLRQAIIQCAIEQNFKTNGTDDYCYNTKGKKNKNTLKCTNIKNLKHLI